MAGACILAEAGTTFIDGNTGKVTAVVGKAGGVSIETIRENICDDYLNRLRREYPVGMEILFYVYDTYGSEYSSDAIVHLEYDGKEYIGELTNDEEDKNCYRVFIPDSCEFKAWAELGHIQSNVLQVNTDDTEDGTFGPYTLRVNSEEE